MQIIDISAAHQIQQQLVTVWDDFPKALKDIADTNRLSSKPTKDSSSTRSAKSGQQRICWQGKRIYDGARNNNNNQSKTTRAPSISEGSKRRRRRATKLESYSGQLNDIKVFWQAKAIFPAWQSITTSQNILYIGQHCHLEIGNPNQIRPRPEIQLDSNEKEIIYSKITHLLELGVIESAVHSTDEYISAISVRKRKVANIA